MCALGSVLCVFCSNPRPHEYVLLLTYCWETLRACPSRRKGDGPARLPASASRDSKLRYSVSFVSAPSRAAGSWARRASMAGSIGVRFRGVTSSPEICPRPGTHGHRQAGCTGKGTPCEPRSSPGGPAVGLGVILVAGKLVRVLCVDSSHKRVPL